MFQRLNCKTFIVSNITKWNRDATETCVLLSEVSSETAENLEQCPNPYGETEQAREAFPGTYECSQRL